MQSNLSFEIEKKIETDKTFRVQKVMADYDLSESNVYENFKGYIELPDNWQIGVIGGGSGTGKSTIIKELFTEHLKKYTYSSKSVIDDMPDCSIEEILKTFYAVGFGSVPSWLKPYKVLSNGEKMRVDLARALLEDEFIVFDEFTSVVDRQVAKTMCIALEKTIRRTNKKIVLVSCHKDILDWVNPDWVFDTDKMQNIYSKKKRKKTRFDIKECSRNEWVKFRKYHYLNHDLNHSAKCYGLYDGESIIGFLAILHMPHQRNKKIKRVHRLVILPDYQGIGLGMKFLDYVANIYNQKGFDVSITTSAKNMIYGLRKNKNWKFTRYGHSPILGQNTKITGLAKTLSANRNTGSFIRERKK